MSPLICGVCIEHLDNPQQTHTQTLLYIFSSRRSSVESVALGFPIHFKRIVHVGTNSLQKGVKNRKLQEVALLNNKSVQRWYI